MAEETVKVSFPRGHHAMNIYSGSFSIREYEGAYVHETNVTPKSIRVTFYKTLEEAKRRHGVDARKTYMTVAGREMSQDELPFRSLQLPTNRFLGFLRKKDSNFRGIACPVYVIERTDTSVTLDVDLTGENISSLIKAAKTPETQRSVAPSKVAKATSKSVARKEEAPAQAKPAVANGLLVRSSAAITLSSELTIGDLKRMGFEITLKDSADQPFILNTK